MKKDFTDILFSILGATAAGVTVFFIDRHLAQKQASSAPVPTPDTIGVDNSFTAQFQAQVAQLGQGSNQQITATASQSASPAQSSSDCGCGGGVDSAPLPKPTLSQQSILNSMNELSSLEANAGNVHYNRPITQLG